MGVELVRRRVGAGGEIIDALQDNGGNHIRFFKASLIPVYLI